MVVRKIHKNQNWSIKHEKFMTSWRGETRDKHNSTVKCHSACQSAVEQVVCTAHVSDMMPQLWPNIFGPFLVARIFSGSNVKKKQSPINAEYNREARKCPNIFGSSPNIFGHKPPNILGYARIDPCRACPRISSANGRKISGTPRLFSGKVNFNQVMVE